MEHLPKMWNPAALFKELLPECSLELLSLLGILTPINPEVKGLADESGSWEA